MKLLIKYFCIFISIFFFEACTKEIDFTDLVSRPQLVVHSYITPGETINVKVTLSRLLTDSSYVFKVVNNADVLVYVNGEFIEKLETVSFSYNEGRYRSSHKPAINDIVKIVVKAPSMHEVSAETYFTQPTTILSVDTTRARDYGTIIEIDEGDTTAVNSDYQLKFALTFKDDAAQANFYRLIVYTKYSEINKYLSEYRTTTEYFGCEFTDKIAGIKSTPNPITEEFEINSAETNRYNVFNDDMINGKTYSLNFITNRLILRKNYPKYNENNQTIKIEIFVSLQSINKEFYNYLISRDASFNTDFFSEPVQIKSNIKGGIGFFGSYTSSNIVKVEIK
jgi:hypothetical protein